MKGLELDLNLRPEDFDLPLWDLTKDILLILCLAIAQLFKSQAATA